MKQIELTQGQITLVDEIDYEYLMQWKWCAAWNTKIHNYYAVRHDNTKITRPLVSIHRSVVERLLGYKLKRHEQIDHLKGNTLDNRRSELAVKTGQGNMLNRGKQQNNISGYKGVTGDEKRFRAWIGTNQKTISLCSQPNTEAGKIECAKMYDRAYLYFFGDMATERGMNFPELKEQYLNDLKVNTYKWMK